LWDSLQRTAHQFSSVIRQPHPRDHHHAIFITKRTATPTRAFALVLEQLQILHHHFLTHYFNNYQVFDKSTSSFIMGNLTTSAKTSFPPLVPVSNCETARYMGTWFVIGVKPTIFETTCSNAVERYTRKDSSKFSWDVDIDFQYNQAEPLTTPLKSLPQKGYILGEDKENSPLWKVSPFWPFKMPYTMIELDQENYSYVVIGYPNRQYAWIMARHPQMPEDTYNMLVQRLVDRHQYSLDGLRRVPQKWTKEEREKRNLTEKEIPDDMLEPTTTTSE
jgi:apolipoprotein D and lipocalin family protein